MERFRTAFPARVEAVRLPRGFETNSGSKMKRGRMAPGTAWNRAAMLMPCNPNLATDRRIMEIIVDAFLMH